MGGGAGSEHFATKTQGGYQTKQNGRRMEKHRREENIVKKRKTGQEASWLRVGWGKKVR